MAFLNNLITLGLLSTILLHTCHAGPAGQIALAAARASKVPRSIRASFRNPEIGVARGFGKRSQQTTSKSLSSRDLVSYFVFPFLPVSTNDNNHERTLRRGRRTRFKLNDHELRISRGFGKRSVDSVSSKSYVCCALLNQSKEVLFFFRRLLKIILFAHTHISLLFFHFIYVRLSFLNVLSFIQYNIISV